jgi:hypothetical protein
MKKENNTHKKLEVGGKRRKTKNKKITTKNIR